MSDNRSIFQCCRAGSHSSSFSFWFRMPLLASRVLDSLDWPKLLLLVSCRCCIGSTCIMLIIIIMSVTTAQGNFTPFSMDIVHFLTPLTIFHPPLDWGYRKRHQMNHLNQVHQIIHTPAHATALGLQTPNFAQAQVWVVAWAVEWVLVWISKRGESPTFADLSHHLLSIDQPYSRMLWCSSIFVFHSHRHWSWCWSILIF